MNELNNIILIFRILIKKKLPLVFESIYAKRKKQKKQILKKLNNQYKLHLPFISFWKGILPYIEYDITLPIHRNTENIEGIIVKRWGRFWNELIQIINALYLARKIGIQMIYLEWCPNFMEKRRYKLDNIIITFNKNDIQWKCCIINNFFYLEKKHVSEIIPIQEYLNINTLIYNNLLNSTIKKNTLSLEINDLVIHIRSGDIFGKWLIHTLYAQPPMAYYLQVIKMAQPWKVILVYEDTANPCVEALQKWLNDKKIPYINFCKNLQETVSLILDAKNICYWRGSFIPQITFLSKERKWNGYAYCNGNLRIHEKFENFYNFEEGDKDYKNTVLKKWKNTQKQKKKMVEYIQGDFEIKIIENNKSEYTPETNLW